MGILTNLTFNSSSSEKIKKMYYQLVFREIAFRKTLLHKTEKLHNKGAHTPCDMAQKIG